MQETEKLDRRRKRLKEQVAEYNNRVNQINQISRQVQKWTFSFQTRMHGSIVKSIRIQITLSQSMYLVDRNLRFWDQTLVMGALNCTICLFKHCIATTD